MTRMVQLAGQLVNLDGIQAPLLVQPNETSSSNYTPNSVTVTPDATAHTKSGWVEVITAGQDSDVIYLRAGPTWLASNSGLALMDIGIGASGSQTVLVANLNIGNTVSLAAGSLPSTQMIPIAVPSGSKLWARIQAGRASAAAVTVEMSLGKWEHFRSPSSLDALSSDTATSGATVTITADNTYVSVAAAAAREYQGFLVALSSADTSMTALTMMGVHLRIGGTTEHVVPQLVGATANEQLYAARSGWGGTFVKAHCPEAASIEVKSNPVSGGSINPLHVVVHGIPMLYPQ